MKYAILETNHGASVVGLDPIMIPANEEDSAVVGPSIVRLLDNKGIVEGNLSGPAREGRCP